MPRSLPWRSASTASPLGKAGGTARRRPSRLPPKLPCWPGKRRRREQEPEEHYHRRGSAHCPGLDGLLAQRGQDATSGATTAWSPNHPASGGTQRCLTTIHEPTRPEPVTLRRVGSFSRPGERRLCHAPSSPAFSSHPSPRLGKAICCPGGGLLIMAFGIAFSIQGVLGTSPISSLPYVVSLLIPLTVGEATICLHVVLILLQILILRRNYDPIQLMQLPVAVVFWLPYRPWGGVGGPGTAGAQLWGAVDLLPHRGGAGGRWGWLWRSSLGWSPWQGRGSSWRCAR